MKKRYLFLCGLGLMALLTSCSKSGKGMNGVLLDDSMMTLDGDTFNVYFQLSDDVFVVGERDAFSSDMLIERGNDGLFRVKLRGDNIYPLDNTSDFVAFEGKSVYHIPDGKSYELPQECESLMAYLGEWKGHYVFSFYGGIWFTGGKVVLTQSGVLVSPIDESGRLALTLGALTARPTAAELSAYDPSAPTQDTSTERLATSYLLSSGASKGGFTLDADIPTGSSPADRDLRAFLLRAIEADVFTNLSSARDLAPSDSAATSSVVGMRAALDSCGSLWKDAFDREFPEHDTIALRLTSDIKIRRVAESDSYVTYYYYDELDEGGAHGMPFSYYVTYDKGSHSLLDVTSLKTDACEDFARLLLSSLTDLYNERHGTPAGSPDAMGQEQMADAMAVATESGFYPCDRLMVMPHMAVLPEGVVVTFHRYQVDSFAGGEYHVLLPAERVRQCLGEDYWKTAPSEPSLSLFVR